MDVLGIFTHLRPGCKPVHWDAEELWAEKCDGGTFAWVWRFARNCVLLLPAAILRMHSKQRQACSGAEVDMDRL